jgi:flavin-dependent dehydrogenase
MNETFDVVIAGGGPAGLAVALALSSHERFAAAPRVLVLEARRYPIDKACGEGVMPAGHAWLARQGLAPALRDAGAVFPGIAFVAPSGARAEGHFAFGSGLAVPRRVLSAALHRRVLEHRNVQVRQDTRVMGIEVNGESATVVLEGGARIRTSLIVGADGRASRIRRWAGLERVTGAQRELSTAPQTLRWGLRRHFHCRPWTPLVEVHLGGGCEAYVTPCGPTTLGVAILWDRAHAPPTAGPLAHATLLRRFTTLNARLRDAVTIDEPAAAGPFATPATRVAGHNVALTGDAAGYVDALTGEGLSLSFTAADALAAAVLPALGTSNALPSAIRAYARAHARAFLPHARFTRMALGMTRGPAQSEAFVSALAADAGLLDRLLAINTGSRKLVPSVLGAPWRFARFFARSQGLWAAAEPISEPRAGCSSS